MSLMAVTRAPGSNLARCELTWIAPQPIDVVRSLDEHRAYESTLASLGVNICRLPAEPDLPDAVFIEDAAVVLDELAVMTRIGAVSRRAEVLNLAPVLERNRELRYIAAPATLDGGDVLRIDRTLYVGLSTRTNREGIEQLRAIAEPLGYHVRAVRVDGCLHLKTGVTALSDNACLINRAWIEAREFAGFELVDVADSEPMAANTLTVGDVVLLPAAFPLTKEKLEARGLNVRSVDIAELQKAEAGLTCLSLVFTV